MIVLVLGPHRKIYLEVLLACSKSGHGREAEVVIDQMRQKNMDVNGKASKQTVTVTNTFVPATVIISKH